VSRSHRTRYLGGTAALVALGISLLVGPASASGTTRWVDDDGKAGSSSCSGTHTAYKSIQKAVTASGAGDIVKVCPGTYVGPVTIGGSRTGLVLRSTTALGATIKAKAVATFSTTYLVTINDVDKVTVKGFKIRPLLDTSHSYCDSSTGIRAISAKTVNITGNDIRPTGTGQFCGLYDGIRATEGTTGTIIDNVVKDYRDDGIDLDGAGTSLTVQDNSVTFAHLNFPSATGNAAILLKGGANGIVKGNTLNGPAAGSGNPSMPAAGVQFDGTGGSTSVRFNTISRFASDLRILHANGGNVHDNTTASGQIGLNLLDGDDMTIYANATSAATVYGLYVAGPANGAAASDSQKATGNNVHDNDFRSSSNGSNKDCQGESAATVAGSNGNTFFDNKGNTSDPAALCDYIPPVP
jgi:hypothetical protein